MSVKRFFLLLNGSSKLLCASTVIIPNRCFKSQSNYIFRQQFFAQSSYLNGSLAFSNFRRFICAKKDKYKANANSEFQALLSNELKLAQLQLDEVKHKSIKKRGYMTLPIESISGAEIQFSLKKVFK